MLTFVKTRQDTTAELPVTLQWGNVDEETKVLFADNPVLSQVFCLKSGLGQNIVKHAPHTARNFFLSNFDFPGAFICTDSLYTFPGIRSG